jgi:hypothetical protein
MNEPCLMTTEDVKQSATEALEMGKKILLEEGHVTRHACLFTLPGAEQKLPENMKIEMEERTTKNAGVPKEELSLCVILDLDPTSQDALGIITELYPDMKPLLGLLFTIGEKIVPDVEKRKAHLAESWMEANKVRPHELVGIFFKHMLKKLEAYAYVHVSETWHISTPTKERDHKYLEDDPNADEALMVTWETKDGGEMMIVPFTREERNKGKVMGFGELKVFPMSETGGRLSSLLYNVKDLEVRRAAKGKT